MNTLSKKGFCGFTLVELLVSIGIMTIILGITLSGGPQSIMKLTLGNNAYQVELTLREAQLQGSAVSSFDGLYGGAGVFFNLATSSSVLKFHDRVDPTIIKPIGIGNGLYDDTVVNNEKETIFNLTNNHKIGKLCVATVLLASGTPDFSCNAENLPSVNTIVKTLTISFTRPKQTAHIYVNGTTATDYISACVQADSLRSPESGYVRSIFVYRSGMITKKVGTCK